MSHTSLRLRTEILVKGCIHSCNDSSQGFTSHSARATSIVCHNNFHSVLRTFTSFTFTISPTFSSDICIFKILFPPRSVKIIKCLSCIMLWTSARRRKLILGRILTCQSVNQLTSSHLALTKVPRHAHACTFQISPETNKST